MDVTLLTVFACTFLIVCLSPFLRKWISPRFILLFFSLGCMAAISLWSTALLLVFSVIVFAGGKSLYRNKASSLFYLLIALCLMPLVLYKTISNEAGTIETSANTIIQIIGLSYFTFNGLSYLADIRKGFLVPEENYDHLLLYLSFFPCIPAGPLHRYKYLDTQFTNALHPSGENLSRGFRLVLWGLFKNLVLAQRLKWIADTILDNPTDYQGGFVLLGGLAFFFQIYCDFSAYVDVGMGFSRMMGVQISQNFSNRVYLSSSRTEFWNGWHKTVNGWFRDYVFFPLVKGRARRLRVDAMLLVTFMLIALWHDLSFKFLLWGLLNGAWILTESKVRPKIAGLTSPVWRGLGVIYHMSLASFTAIIFRTADLSASWHALLSPAKQQFGEDGMLRRLVYIVPLFLLADQVNRAMKEETIDAYLGRLGRGQRWAFYFCVALAIMMSGLLPVENYYYARF